MTDGKRMARPDAIGAGTPPPSRQVAWFEVYLFLQAVVEQVNVGPLPAAGTPAWLALADGDPRKLLSLAEAGVHHILRIDIEQEARAEASHDISAAVDCRALARDVRNHEAIRIRRRAS